jgi:hypothetical protein
MRGAVVVMPHDTHLLQLPEPIQSFVDIGYTFADVHFILTCQIHSITICQIIPVQYTVAGAYN